MQIADAGTPCANGVGSQCDRQSGYDGKTIGTAHPAYATHLNNLAGLLRAMGRHAEAEPLCRQALDILRAKLGPDHPSTKRVEANYATFLAQRGGGG